MLNWLVSYLSYHGYQINGSNFNNGNNYNPYNNCNNYNDCSNYNSGKNYNSSNYDWDYGVNYQQQSHASPSRRQREREARRNRAIANANQNRQNQKRKILEETNLKKGLETKIEEGNKGYELLKKMGYENGKGLGRNAEGMLEPIKLEKKIDRKGLGAAVAKKKVAAQQQISKADKIKASKVTKAQPIEANEQKLVATKQVAIAIPQPVQKCKQIEVNKLAVVPLIQEVQKPLQQPVDSRKLSHTTCQKSNLPIQKVTALPIITTTKNSKVNKETFSIKDPCTPEFLHSLARAFHSEIELMQLRLAAEASLQQMPDDNDLIVVKIYIANNPNVADHVFEFIRTELVGWIGAYQQEGMNTPIFHNITNNSSHITIVCDNNYAFQCLERCIEEIAQMKTMDSLKILRLPSITPMVYCFDAKYEGIASDADLFMLQLHLHKPKLYTENWIVASQEVCAEDRKTFFIFLIDERSALALNFQYNRSFFICMQQVTFRSRGVVRDTITN